MAMFENISEFFKRIMQNDKKELLAENTTSQSKDTAKDRLHVVLMQDRANVSADFLELMKEEIIEVIKKYIVVDETKIDVRLTNEENEDGSIGVPLLHANIPILNIRNDLKGEYMHEVNSPDKIEGQQEIELDDNNEKTQVVQLIKETEIENNEEEIAENVNEKENNPTEEQDTKIEDFDENLTEEIKNESVDFEEENLVKNEEDEISVIDENVVENEKDNQEKLDDEKDEELNKSEDVEEENTLEDKIDELEDEEDDDDDVTFDDLLKAAEEEEERLKQTKANNEQKESKVKKQKKTTTKKKKISKNNKK